MTDDLWPQSIDMQISDENQKEQSQCRRGMFDDVDLISSLRLIVEVYMRAGVPTPDEYFQLVY